LRRFLPYPPGYPVSHGLPPIGPEGLIQEGMDDGAIRDDD